MSDILARADKIIADGLIAFIGEGLSVEIATRRYMGGPVNVERGEEPIMDIGGEKFYEWKELGQVYADKSGRLRYKAKKEYQNVNVRASGGVDAALPHIALAGPPGSVARLDAMRDHAAAHELLGDNTSAYALTDDDIAVRLAERFFANMADTNGATQIKRLSQRERADD